ncbi:MAG: T9SS type A sorting domain-containing protein [Bacteroidales bacterium]|nr:T9SS type A sorting domain-containing protein [Bacteroidales bacterium]
MKKVSLLSLAAALLMGGSLMAQEPQVLISDQFEEYTVGNKIAVEAIAAGHDWWTTWENNPGSSEDGVVAEFDGSKCGYLTYGVDQVLLLGDEQSGIYDLEFDILVPNGKNAYFNILHNFAGSGSTWALESYLHMSGNNTSAPGTGVIHAGGSNAATFTCVYDAWMHFRLHVDTDNDVAEYYYTAPGESEQMIHTWQWSLNSQGSATVGRKLAAMDFFPPQNAANSEYYLDNFSFTKLSGESIAHLDFNPENIEVEIEADEMTTSELTISNAEGTTIGEWCGWIDFGQTQGGTAVQSVNYDREPGAESSLVGYSLENPTIYELAAMFPASAYGGAVMGTLITSAQYPFFSSSTTQSIGIEPNTDVTFRIYRQGMFGQPGDVLAEKVIPYNQVVSDDWTIATFDEPVALTGFDVWVGVEFTHAVGGYPLSFDGQAPHNPNGVYIRTGGGGAFEEMQGSEDYGNYHIRMTCQGAPVQGAWATMNKQNGSIAIGQSDEVTISLNSFGLEENSAYEAKVIFVTNDPDNEEVIIPLVMKVGTVSIAENENQLANIYPNPATTSVTLEGENLNSVAIYNVAGQLVRVVKLESLINTITLDIEAGVYFFSVYDNNGNNSVTRVVITK